MPEPREAVTPIQETTASDDYSSSVVPHAPFADAERQHEWELVDSMLEALREPSRLDSRARAAAGAAFVRYVEGAVARGVLRVLLSRLRGQDLVLAKHDAFNATFEALCRREGHALSLWDRGRPLRPYIFTIARRSALKYVSARPQLIQLDEQRLESSGLDDVSVERQIADREFIERLWLALRERLKPRDLQLFELFMVHRSIDDIGHELGLTSNAVHQRLFRLKKIVLAVARRLREEV